MDHDDTYRLVVLPEEQWATAIAALRAVGRLASETSNGECARVAIVADEIMRQIQQQIYADTFIAKGRDGKKWEVSEENYATNINAQ